MYARKQLALKPIFVGGKELQIRIARIGLRYKVEQTPGNLIRGTLFGKTNLPAAKQYYQQLDQKNKAPASAPKPLPGTSNRFGQ